MTDTSAAPQANGPDALVAEVAKIMQRLGRSDLAQRASVAAARLKRPSTIVCVVGEFKQGVDQRALALLELPHHAHDGGGALQTRRSDRRPLLSLIHI